MKRPKFSPEQEARLAIAEPAAQAIYVELMTRMREMPPELAVTITMEVLSNVVGRCVMNTDRPDTVLAAFIQGLHDNVSYRKEFEARGAKIV